MEQETLRDKFAMAALTGMLNNHYDLILSGDIRRLSEFSYKIADAMLKEREKQNKE